MLNWSLENFCIFDDSAHCLHCRCIVRTGSIKNSGDLRGMITTIYRLIKIKKPQLHFIIKNIFDRK